MGSRIARPLLLVMACTLALALSIALPAAARCAKPGPAPPVPSGLTANKDQMTAGHNAVQAYVNALLAYKACLEQDIVSAPPDVEPVTKQTWGNQADAALSEANSLAEDFSSQLKIFNAQHPQ